jgi:hypothetical protein
MSIAQLLIPNKAYLKPFLAGLPSALSDDIADEWNARLAKPATASSWLRSAPANSWLKFTTEAIRSIGVPRALYLDEADIDAKAKALSRIRVGCGGPALHLLMYKRWPGSTIFTYRTGKKSPHPGFSLVPCL